MTCANRKGKGGEIEAARVLSDTWPNAARNGRQRSEGGADVEGTPVWVEVKRGARQPQVIPALNQACRESDRDGDDRPRVAMTRRDRGEWIVSMRLHDFKRIATGDF